MTSLSSGHYHQEHQSPIPSSSNIIDRSNNVIRHQLIDHGSVSTHHSGLSSQTNPQHSLSPSRAHNSLRRDVIKSNAGFKGIKRASTLSDHIRTQHHHNISKKVSSTSMPQMFAEGGEDDISGTSSLGKQSITRSDITARTDSNARERRRKSTRQQLSPHMYGHYSGNAESSTIPSAPRSPTSVRSKRSHRSSRHAIEEIATESTKKMTDQQDLQVITRNMSSYRLVHLLYQCDADLFDAIQEWKNQHPDLWVDDAIDAFASARGSDALAQLVYSTEAFDIILKFSASSKDLESIFDSHSRYSQSQHASSIAPKSPLTDQQQQGQGGYNLFGTPSHLESPCQSLPNQSSTDSSVAQPLDCFTDLSPSAQTPSTANNVSQAASPSFVLDANTNHQNSPYPSPSSSSILAQDYKPQQQQQPDALGEAQRVRKRRHRRPSRAKMKEWKTRLHRCNYQLALLKEGLFLELEKSINSDAVFVKVLAPFWRLAEEAQTTNCKAELANSILPSIPYSSRMFPAVSRLLPCLKKSGLEQRREVVLFKTAHLMDFYLAEPSRKWSDVVRHAGAIHRDGTHAASNCGSDSRPGFFQTSRRGYLVNSIMMRTESGNNPYGRKMGLRSALRHGAYSKLFALHDGPYKLQSKPLNEANDRAQLRVRWARRFWRSQPLDLVNAYYGERIGIYFAWLGHYTKWLTLPSIVGLAVFIFGVINAANLNQLDATPNVLFAIFDNALTMPFALFMSLWSTIYIEFWKRANQYYAFCWNMIDYERVELPRTEFRPTRVRFSPVTGKREMYYPAYRKALHIFASSVAVVIALLLVIGSVACLMIFKSWCRNHLGGTYITTLATAMLNLVVIIILGEIWCRLAEWLTDKENHKYTDSYEDSLIIKRYLFDFANMYATLFYYAFFKAPFGGRLLNRHDLRDTCIYDSCITELSVQLAVVFIGKQFLNGLFESVFPWIKKTWHRKRIFAEQALQRLEFLQTRKQSRAPEWVKDDELPGYDGRILKCYRKTVIQFGFCTLFVTSFPVAPAFALINNCIDIRMEAFRLSTQYRRPIAYRAQDIGIWEKIMEFISFSSVITNAAIIAFSSLWIKQNLFSKFIDTAKDEELLAARLGFILVFEHIIFVSKIILRAAIPSVPLTIKLAIQRSKYMNRFANGGLDSGMDDDDYYNDDMDSLYHSDITDSDENSDPNEIISTLGPSAQRPNDQIELRNGHNTIILGGTEEVNENTAARTKKNSRPGLESARSWSSRILRLGEPSSKIE